MNSSNDRRFAILEAIVKDYIDTHEPVGSKSLVERHSLGVSSATVRSDMAILESEGYLKQNHSSSGRIPTDLGYRKFVDKLGEVKPFSKIEKKAVLSFLESSVDLDDVLKKSAQLLSQLTHQVAMIQYPVFSRENIRHTEIIKLGDKRLSIIIIFDSGRVEQRFVELDSIISDNDYFLLKDLISNALANKSTESVGYILDSLEYSSNTFFNKFLQSCINVLKETVFVRSVEKFVISGTSNLSRNKSNFGFGSTSIAPILEALEEQVVILKILAETTSNTQSLNIKIGEENMEKNLKDASIVAASYGDAAVNYGSLAVVGPTRMDYPYTISSVLAVARYVGKVLSGS